MPLDSNLVVPFNYNRGVRVTHREAIAVLKPTSASTTIA